jgi:hypothetical protein
MLNCYWQIFGTYFTQLRQWVYRLLLFCFALVTLAQGYRPPLGFAELFTLFYFLATVLHLKRQFAVPQATLIPHYRLRHLIVAGFLLLPVLILTPVCASLGFHIPLLPIMGLVLAFCALAGCAVYLTSLPLTVIALVLGAAPLTDTASRIVASLLVQPPPGMVPLLFIGGLVGFAILVVRLMHLTEEMPEYSRNNPLNGGETATFSSGLRISSKPNYTSRWQQFFSAGSDRAIDRVASSSHETFFQRVARSRAPTKNKGVALLSVFLCVALFLIETLVYSTTFNGTYHAWRAFL